MALYFPSFLPLSLSFFFFCCCWASVSAAISPGSALSASNQGQSWASPGRVFYLTFITDNSTGSLFAAIVYNGGVPIWKAGGDLGGAVDSSATLQFLPNGNLQLRNGSNSLVWESNTGRLGVTSASLDDSGNFMLKNGSGTVWSTFDNPTDTIVPNQSFTTNHVLRSGNYSFRLMNTGNMTLTWNDSIQYYSNAGLNSSADYNLTSPSLSLQPIGILSLLDPNLANSLIMAYSNDYAEVGNILRFVKLDTDGNLRIYGTAFGTKAMIARWSAVQDQCQVYGFCGDMGICRYIDSDPVCGCPSQNFVPVDPNDGKKGCKRKVEIQDCPGNATMLQLNNSKFLTYPPQLSSEVFFVGISACRLNCLVSSSCVASTVLSDGTGHCYLKVPGFVSGYQSAALPSTSYVKICGPAIPNPSLSSADLGKNSLRLHPWVVGIVIVATILGLILLEGCLWWLCFRNNPKFGALSTQYTLLEYASGAPVQFSYKELQNTTKGFREKLGVGGFGAVYRGVLSNRTVAAVKQLEGIEQGEKQFRMEVATISSTHHLNLVRLIGFCSEGRHRLLVYEFMKNGSLDNYLFSSEEQSGKLLNWESRFNIAVGTARGIMYLHEECRDCIVHCDIKPENILLDENYNAKVSDFGLAKLINPKDHRYRTLKSVRGTRGYLAPEWIANLPITSKSDVYGYGMVLLEIVSGRRNFDVSTETNHRRFSLWAYEEFEKGNMEAILDRRLLSHEIDMEQAVRAIQVSFWCIQEQPSHRPTMGKVVQMLEGIVQIEMPPAPKSVPEGSATVTSINASSIGAFSSIAASAPAPSSISSPQTGVASSFTSVKNLESVTNSFLKSEIK